MKKLILMLFVVPLVGCDRQNPNGRFQMMAGTYDEIVNGQGVEVTKLSGPEGQHHGIFKIDTQTGQTWVYMDVINATPNGTTFENGWREIKDLLPSK